MPRKKNIFKKGYRAVKKMFKKLSPFALLQLKAKRSYAGYGHMARSKASNAQRDPNAPAPIALNHIRQGNIRFRRFANAPNSMNSIVGHPADASTYSYGQCLTHAGPKTDYYGFQLGSVYDIDDIFQKMNSVDGMVAGYSGKLDLQDANMKIRMTNAAQSTTSLVVYECVARRDCPDVLGNLQQIIQDGFLRQTVAQVTHESIGGSLYQNALFCSYWEIKSVQRRELHPGATLSLSTNAGAKLINPIVWNSSNTSSDQGYSRCFVIQATGMACNGTGDTNNTVEIAGVKLDCVVEIKYHFRSTFDSVGRQFFATGLTANTVKNYVNPVSGLVQNDATA